MAVLCLFLGACQSMPAPVAEQAPARQSIKVPFHAQEKYQCGPAALAMMLGWAGTRVSPARLKPEVWLPERQGSLIMELEGAARARGLLVYPVNSPTALFRELQAGHPVLVMQNLGLSFWPQWHFAVAHGYTDDGQHLVLHSGTEADHQTHWNRFVRTWARADYRAFVALPPAELPASAEANELVRALQALHQTTGPKAALAHWRAAADAFPNQYLVQFSLGNVLWESDARLEATRAFQRATRARPQAAAGWNNLAEALHQQGCPKAAGRAAERAGQLAPDNPAVRDTLRKVNTAQGAGSSCPLSAPDSGEPAPAAESANDG